MKCSLIEEHGRKTEGDWGIATFVPQDFNEEVYGSKIHMTSFFSWPGHLLAFFASKPETGQSSVTTWMHFLEWPRPWALISRKFQNYSSVGKGRSLVQEGKVSLLFCASWQSGVEPELPISQHKSIGMDLSSFTTTITQVLKNVSAEGKLAAVISLLHRRYTKVYV